MSVEQQLESLVTSPTTPSSGIACGQLTPELKKNDLPSSSYSNLVRALEGTPIENAPTQSTIQFTPEASNEVSNVQSSTGIGVINTPTNIPQNYMVHQTPTVSAYAEAKNSITVQNCVSTVNLCCQLNLTDINCRTRNSEYNPGRFTGLVMRIRDPRCTALIFKTGKLVCTGARNEADNNLAARKMARIIQKLGYNIQFREFKIQNLVATVDLRFPIRLENLYQVHGQFSSYEPELFPGLIYRMVRPRVVLLIFVNGKIVFTGAKDRSDLADALDNIYPILLSYRKK